jgi:hypothetical protein
LERAPLLSRLGCFPSCCGAVEALRQIGSFWEEWRLFLVGKLRHIAHLSR